ncbi:hypothetical protein [Burkholderia ubonensis]|uniref:hypothetical protein n=1 Tax=Burkholderia ubonensis TaxID=101571 RepID=UPI000B206558|nr:hypothetical protein [Burkholderia ubonensis]
MNPTLDQVGVADGQALLAQLPGVYFEVLSTARLEQEADRSVQCKFEVPGVGTRATSATTAREAIRSALVELSSLLIPSLPSNLSSDMQVAESSAGGEGTATSRTSERFQSKARQLTVGVTMPTNLKCRLSSLAEEQGTSFADVSRRLTVAGFEDFEEMSFSVSSQLLFATLASELRKWLPSDSEQVMLRLEPYYAIRLRTAAKEYSKSASELSAMCLAHGLKIQQQLVSLEKKIASYRGAAIRPLASQLGLDGHAALLSSILAGTVRAPKAILTRLSNIFEASETILTLFFRRSFESRAVPAFKAENAKPEIPDTAKSWEDAVKAMKLSQDQTKALLDLDA